LRRSYGRFKARQHVQLGALATGLSAPKYSSPTLRPPKIVAWLSAVRDLL